MSFQRVRCPKCNNEDPRMLKEIDDKSKVLFFSMQGQPVFSKIVRCGRCSMEFEKPK
jgi:hypothetical protein